MPFALGTFSRGSAGLFPGVVLGDRVIALTALVPCTSLLSLLDEWPRLFPALQDSVRKLQDGGLEARANDLVPLEQLRVHAPIAKPGTIYCSGANYKKHVA